MTNNPLSDFEREQLKNRILRSAAHLSKRREKRRKTRILYAAAACALILFGITRFFNDSQVPTLEDFIIATPTLPFEKNREVTVVLGNGNIVSIPKADGDIQYSQSGTNVQVGTEESVQQEAIKDKEPVFNTVLVPYGKRTSVTLSDGTKVWINSGSRFVFPAVFIGNERKVFLEGEAIFDVAHNTEKPFKVLSGIQEIEVLGTVFNVNNYPEDQEAYTVLKSGSVKITLNKDKGNAFKIVPGTLAKYNNKTKKVITKRVDVDEYMGWREGFLSLKNQSLANITTKLSRYYNVEIVIEDDLLRQETFSGKLDLKENITHVIDIIRNATIFSVEHKNETIILTRKS